MTTDTKDDLGQEIPGEVWHTAMRFTGLRAARRIVELEADLKQAGFASHVFETAANTYCEERDAARKEADELRAQRDRAERLLQEQATLIKQLEERLRQATPPADRSTLPTVPPRVGYRYERRDGSTTDIVEDRGDSYAYRYCDNDGQPYHSEGIWWRSKGPSALDLVREIGPIEQGDAK